MLNEALLRQRNDLRFCTVAYAYSVVGEGARVGLASGGHPLPLLLRPDGDRRAVGEPGTLLGIVPDPRLEDAPCRCRHGDALVFYTDGVTESRGADGSLGRGQAGRAALGLRRPGADAIAAEVEGAARARTPGRDGTTSRCWCCASAG